MSFSAVVMADSYSPDHDSRLTTLEVTFPRFILAELNTHRVFSRNSSSSRAIPTWKILNEVRDNPFVPDVFGSYRSGMVSGDPLDEETSSFAESQWLEARDAAMYHAMHLVYGERATELFIPFKYGGESLPKEVENGAHKELVNRLLEPFMWQTAIVSSTEWENFFRLRCADNAQPQIRTLAQLMKIAIDDSTPTEKSVGSWHVPFVSLEEIESMEIADILMLSAGRCARVSYLNHHRDREPGDDIALARRLLKDCHMSPFEHQARPLGIDEIPQGNFVGWMQQRHIFDPS